MAPELETLLGSASSTIFLERNSTAPDPGASVMDDNSHALHVIAPEALDSLREL